MMEYVGTKDTPLRNSTFGFKNLIFEHKKSNIEGIKLTI